MLTVTQATHHCAVPHGAKVDAALVLAALATMRGDGGIKRLLQRDPT